MNTISSKKSKIISLAFNSPQFSINLRGTIFPRKTKLKPLILPEKTPAPCEYTIPSVFSPNKIISSGKTATFHGGGPRSLSLIHKSPKELRPGPGAYEPYKKFGLDGKFIKVTRRKRVFY